MQTGNNAHGNRVAKFAERISDGDDALSNAQRVRIAESQRLEIASLNFQNRDILKWVARQLKEKFVFGIFELLKNIFTKEETLRLNNLEKEYQKNKGKISDELFKKEMERLTVELSWKSSQIEGNTYSLLETEVLIKEQKEADGHLF